MKKHRIKLTTGEEFPVEINLGAMLLFKQETGKEATDADMGSLSDLTMLLWCGTSSASEVAGVKFDYTPQQFANRLTPESLMDWTRELAKDPQPETPEEEDQTGDGKKKKAES
ncbi:MAG: hypothetical protein K2G53_09575 [Muribaculaceae bacterium]|nr:hypothetical protein [Muribaculaceae bacterium]